ncbi:MAG: hypothetical protein AB1777_01700 [Bacteroidota bacterium]
MKSKLMLLFLATLFLSGSCEKEFEYTLPPATQKGANTIGCKVNGVVCIPHGAIIFSPYTKRLCYNEQTGEIDLGVLFLPTENDIKNGIPRFGVSVRMDSIFSPGVFIDFSGTISIGYYDEHGGQLPDKEYYYTQNISGQLNITKLDKQNNIISGIFNFDGVLFLGLGEWDYSQLAKVTDGRFDIGYNEDGSCILEYVK